jgi:hypothetical protein
VSAIADAAIVTRAALTIMAKVFNFIKKLPKD